ncbi:MAG: hypothetical protein SGPRY_002249 [Prymnesium sp.]
MRTDGRIPFARTNDPAGWKLSPLRMPTRRTRMSPNDDEEMRSDTEADLDSPSSLEEVEAGEAQKKGRRLWDTSAVNPFGVANWRNVDNCKAALKYDIALHARSQPLKGQPARHPRELALLPPASFAWPLFHSCAFMEHTGMIREAWAERLPDAQHCSIADRRTVRPPSAYCHHFIGTISQFVLQYPYPLGIVTSHVDCSTACNAANSTWPDKVRYGPMWASAREFAWIQSLGARHFAEQPPTALFHIVAPPHFKLQATNFGAARVKEWWIWARNCDRPTPLHPPTLAAGILPRPSGHTAELSMLRRSATDPAMAASIVRSLDVDPWSAPEAGRAADQPASTYEPMLARMRSAFPAPSRRPRGLETLHGRPRPSPGGILGCDYDRSRPVEKQAECFRQYMQSAEPAQLCYTTRSTSPDVVCVLPFNCTPRVGVDPRHPRPLARGRLPPRMGDDGRTCGLASLLPRSPSNPTTASAARTLAGRGSVHRQMAECSPPHPRAHRRALALRCRCTRLHRVLATLPRREATTARGHRPTPPRCRRGCCLLRPLRPHRRGRAARAPRPPPGPAPRPPRPALSLPRAPAPTPAHYGVADVHTSPASAPGNPTHAVGSQLVRGWARRAITTTLNNAALHDFDCLLRGDTNLHRPPYIVIGEGASCRIPHADKSIVEAYLGCIRGILRYI